MIPVVTYLTYLVIALPLTAWVAGTLSRNGRVLLEDVSSGDDALPDAVNRLLVMGFSLVALGFVFLLLRVGPEPVTVRGMLEVLSVKIGCLVLVLGVVHLLDVIAFSMVRRHSRLQRVRQASPAPQGLPGYPGYPAPGVAYPGPVRR